VLYQTQTDIHMDEVKVDGVTPVAEEEVEATEEKESAEEATPAEEEAAA